MEDATGITEFYRVAAMWQSGSREIRAGWNGAVETGELQLV